MTNGKAFFFHTMLCGVPYKVWPRFGVGLPTPNDPIKKAFHRHARLHGS